MSPDRPSPIANHQSPRVVTVALPIPLRRSFSYRVPESFPMPKPGSRVRVPFGERSMTGVVVDGGIRTEEPEPDRLREVIELLDLDSVLPPELLAIIERVAERFFTSAGEVLRSALPARLPAAGAVRYRITERGALARAGGSEAEILQALSGGEAIRAADLPGAARQEALRNLEERGWIRAVSLVRARVSRPDLAYAPVPMAEEERREKLGRSRRGPAVLAWLDSLGRPALAGELRLQIGAGAGVLRDLVARGVLRCFEQTPRAGEPPATARPAIRPTDEQAAAIAEISDAIRNRRYLPVLLHGVTGSGKTEVYLRAIAAALEAGRGAVWLVPEIALTPVFARELARQFGDRAAVLHSALSDRERGQAWDRVRDGSVRVVIGPRSAAFAPVTDPGLFVVDEEHDPSYKQRESPRYDARDVAALRARSAPAALVFGSATPSMEAYQAALDGRVRALRLSSRIDGRPLPSVEIVDLKREPWQPDEKGVPLFSRPLERRLGEVFAAGQQAILLQPRRGFAPFLLCRDCGFDFPCTRCSVHRTVHGRGRSLVCHYCGQALPRPARCPECGGAALEAIGAGTERVAERFAALFPGVAFSVLDRDTARRRGAQTIVEEVISGRVQCLIGTQMVAKGHDFPDVTAVGVLSADTLLNLPDFRAAEKTFQLVAQVAGRAGRGKIPGTVHVQTFHPGHPAIRSAAAHDVDGFARAELDFRRAFFYPPFSELAAILVSSADRNRAEQAASAIGEHASAAGEGLRISGPAPAPLERLLGRWRFQILLRAPDRPRLIAALEACVAERPPSGVQIAVDVDPQDLM